MAEESSGEHQRGVTVNFIISTEEDAMLKRLAPGFPRNSRSAAVRKAIRELAKSTLGIVSKEDFWRPGNIVRLKQPLTPERFSESTPGPWTHPWLEYGVIAEAASRDGAGNVLLLNLLLFDAEGRMDVVAPGMPLQRDYAVDEVEPWKDASQVGYQAIKEA